MNRISGVSVSHPVYPVYPSFSSPHTRPMAALTFDWENTILMCSDIFLVTQGALMSHKSAIEWTNSTWNPVTGCTKVSAGCDHCYAERLSERFRGVEGHPFDNGSQTITV